MDTVTDTMKAEWKLSGLCTECGVTAMSNITVRDKSYKQLCHICMLHCLRRDDAGTLITDPSTLHPLYIVISNTGERFSFYLD